MQADPATVHLHKFHGLRTGCVAIAQRDGKLAQDSLLEFFHVVPGGGVHVEDSLVHGINGFVAVSFARFRSVVLFVFAHGAPALKLGQNRAHERDRLVKRHARVLCQSRPAILDHGFHGGLIGVVAAVIAPLAVMVGFLAGGIGPAIVGRKVHAAAFAIMLGHFKQMGQRLAGDGGNELHHVDPRRDLAALPAAHGLAGDVEFLGKLVLREVVRAPHGNEFFCEGHDGSSRRGRFDDISIRSAGRLS